MRSILIVLAYPVLALVAFLAGRWASSLPAAPDVDHRSDSQTVPGRTKHDPDLERSVSDRVARVPLASEAQPRQKGQKPARMDLLISELLSLGPFDRSTKALAVVQQIIDRQSAEDLIQDLDGIPKSLILGTVLRALAKAACSLSPDALQNEGMRHLKSELWQRMQAAGDGARKAALLSFFVEHPILRHERLVEISDLAQRSTLPAVRKLAIGGLSGLAHRPEVSSTLCQIVEQARDPIIRRYALYGLRTSTDKQARELIQRALDDPAEDIRVAALKIRALPDGPKERERFGVYLEREFERASQHQSQFAVLDRILSFDVPRAERVLRTRLSKESDAISINYYKALLSTLAAGIRDRSRIHGRTRKEQRAFLIRR